MIGQMSIVIAFPGFNDLGRTVTPVFLLMDHFLPDRFFLLTRKNEENLSTRKFGIIYATDPLLQNKTKIVCSGDSPSIFLTIINKPL